MVSRKKNKHTSTLIRKKWRKTKPYICCGAPLRTNITKPMKAKGWYCAIRFYKSRQRMILAKREIDELMKGY